MGTRLIDRLYILCRLLANTTISSRVSQEQGCVLKAISGRIHGRQSGELLSQPSLTTGEACSAFPACLARLICHSLVRERVERGAG